MDSRGDRAVAGGGFFSPADIGAPGGKCLRVSRRVRRQIAEYYTSLISRCSSSDMASGRENFAPLTGLSFTFIA